MEIKAPLKFTSCPRPWIFLAGSIEMGKANNWQHEVVIALPDITILNPRRDDWDNSWEQSIDNPQFKEQVEWELLAQEEADMVLFHFEADTKSPVTLLELGLFKDRAVVHCPQGYWRKGNVDIVCKYYGVQMVNSIDKLIQEAISKMQIPSSTPSI